MRYTIFIFFLLFHFTSYTQVTGFGTGIFLAKEFSKEIALYKAKYFLFNNIIGTSAEVTQFEVIPLAAASSGELTTLLYKCESKNIEGLILGFYGNYWNNSGVLYQGFAFKNLPKNKAYEFLNKIENSINSNNRFLGDNNDNNNIVFRFEDIDVLIWNTTGSYVIRLFWNGFDSTWDQTAYVRSKRRFEKKIK
jgi:hypothetical protein